MSHSSKLLGIMRRHFVHLVNTTLLIIVFIMLPSITGRNLGSLRLSDHSVLHQLTVGALCLAIALNLAMARWTVRTRKERGICLGWTALFALFLIVSWGHAAGWLHFHWLKRSLLWIRDRF